MRLHGVSIVLGLCTALLQAAAQPSGGPYGPVRQTYVLPAGPGAVYYVAVDGLAGQSGKSLSNPTTLEAAIEKVRTGDAVVMRGEHTGQAACV